MCFLLCSKDLLDVCEKAIGQDETPSAINWWTKLSFEAITTHTSIINCRVFLEVINAETSNKANVLWFQINKQYAFKRAKNKAHVWMNWQKANYSGNLHQYIEDTRKFFLKLESVSIKIPSEILSYIILWKLAGDPKLSQVVELLTLNEEIIEKPDQILSCLQEYANNLKTKDDCQTTVASASALVSVTNNEPHRILYYCANGKHNPKCLTHKQEKCFSENPQLRPQRQDNKRKAPNASPDPHISTVQALHTGILLKSKPQQIVVDCRATHHMFNSKDFFTSLAKDTKLPVTTGDSDSNLIAEGIGNSSVLSNNQYLKFPNSLFVPKLNCNLESLLKLFNEELIITWHENLFSLTTEGKEFLHAEIENNLMKFDYHPPTSHQTMANVNPWHERLGHVGTAVIKSMGLPPMDLPCKTFNLNKAHRLPFGDHFEPAHLPFDCFHIDLVGLISPPSISGYQYFLTIVDQATSFKIVRFLKNKSDAFHQFTITKTLMETQHNGTQKASLRRRGGVSQLPLSETRR
ncbi:hypothetical protein O181_009194 [Austropuccinia psidii MF-1]|uniref:Retrovirus-related Pol polyprotein from transposon TNT 1-94-like beta-barrel domain-containing protein n=1 Tax=Austropuccinia psidii MF-1 TaxID=1389203 RepID=A0A9Q3GJL6_9BASI|nr:hypothetical protein [Austropuccinia psidii MF-1]